MSFQYPHLLKFSLSTEAPSLVDGVNVFSDTEDMELACRAESNSKGNTMATASGNIVNYSYTVYLPVMSINVPIDTKCKLKLSDNVEFDLQVKWHENGRFNSRVWL